MSKIKIIILTVIFTAGVFVFNSCRTNETIDPDIDIPELGGYDYERTALDDWLDENYLYPYNVKVYYRWDAILAYTNLNSKLVPVQVDKVKPMMDALAKVWFEPFFYAAPSGFLQKYTPKTIVLIGSPQYSSDGSTVMLGQAEGAAIIYLTNANAFDPANAIGLKKYLHVIEHEFVHILVQNVLMPTSFKSVSPFYDPTGWQNYSSDAAVYPLGFISRYAMSSPEEDFAEMVSLVMVDGLDNFRNNILPIAAASTVNPYAATMLQEKLRIAVEYYQKNFGINLYDDPATGKTGLINLVQQAVDNEVIAAQQQ